MTKPAHSLSDQLGETVGAFMSSLPEDDAQIVGASFEKLHRSHTGESAIAVGEIAPNFTLLDATGKAVNLRSKLNEGPLVLSFYRGGWCPFCNLELQALQALLPEIKALGANLIGISPETPDTSMTTVEKQQLQFDVLSDVGNNTARDYGHSAARLIPVSTASRFTSENDPEPAASRNASIGYGVVSVRAADRNTRPSDVLGIRFGAAFGSITTTRASVTRST